jgi:hypothetical protein
VNPFTFDLIWTVLAFVSFMAGSHVRAWLDRPRRVFTTGGTLVSKQGAT